MIEIRTQGQCLTSYLVVRIFIYHFTRPLHVLKQVVCPANTGVKMPIIGCKFTCGCTVAASPEFLKASCAYPSTDCEIARTIVHHDLARHPVAIDPNQRIVHPCECQ